MTKCAPAWRLFLFLFLAISLAGCSQLKRSGVADEKDPHFIDGKRRVSGMDWDGAIQSFERALQSNPGNAAAHLELGIIYDKRKNDFATAIYHYQKHMKLHANSRNADYVTQQIAFCKRELAKTHSYTSVSRDVQRELEKLTMANVQQGKRIEFLEAELNRGPRYITNYVTNFVKMPQFEQQGSRHLTQPAQIVDPPERDTTPDPDPEPPARPTERSSKTANSDSRSGSVLRNTSSPRNTQTRRSRSEAARSTPVLSSPKIKTVHTVRPGDTLQAVANHYGLSATELRAANPGLGSGTRSGQKINIPAK